LVQTFYSNFNKGNEIIQLDNNNEAIVDGIRIKGISCKEYKFPIVGIILNIISFSRALWKTIKTTEADIYHCHDHKICLHAFLYVLKKLKKQKSKAKFVWDAHEYYHGMIIDLYKYKLSYLFFKPWMSFLDRQIMKYIDFVITADEATQFYYCVLNPYVNTSVLLNVPSKKIFSFNPGEIRKNGTFTLIHEGIMAFNRGLVEMVELMKKIKKENLPIKLKILGKIPSKERNYLDSQIIDQQLQDYIFIAGTVPYEQVGKEIQSCHVGLVTLHPTLNCISAMANKFFNYMLYGLPVIASNFPEMARVIRESDCGVTFITENSSDLFQKVFELYSNKEYYNRLSANAFALANRKNNWEEEEKILQKIYSQLVAN
jgi:glycosyltransferase involved in cell wall biosynthesis